MDKQTIPISPNQILLRVSSVHAVFSFLVSYWENWNHSTAKLASRKMQLTVRMTCGFCCSRKRQVGPGLTCQLDMTSFFKLTNFWVAWFRISLLGLFGWDFFLGKFRYLVTKAFQLKAPYPNGPSIFVYKIIHLPSCLQVINIVKNNVTINAFTHILFTLTTNMKHLLLGIFEWHHQ